MILHVYYLIKNKQEDLLDPPVMYAITDDQAYANEFEETRNMSLFFHKVIKCKRKEGMKNMDRLKEYILTKTPLLTKNEFGGSYSVNILCTWREETKVFLKYNELYYDLIRPNLLISPRIFSDKIQSILKRINYLKYWDVKESEFNEYAMTQIDLSIKIDELVLYLKSYGWMMKHGKE